MESTSDFERIKLKVCQYLKKSILNDISIYMFCLSSKDA